MSAAGFDVTITANSFDPRLKAGDVVRMEYGATAKKGDIVALGNGRVSIGAPEPCRLGIFSEGKEYFAVAVAVTSPIERQELHKQHNFGIVSAGNAFTALWNKAADQMTVGELQWFVGLTDCAERETHNLAGMIEGIGCAIINDETSGAFENRDTVAELLFGLAHQLNTIRGMIRVGNSAEYRLRHPELYQQFKETNLAV